MIYFNDNTIYVGYIKQLLASFNLPQCKVYDKDVIYAKGDSYIKGNSLYVVTDNNGTAKRTRNYKFGDYIENLTKTLSIKNNNYDSHTHNYLGEYLRFVRDYTGLDLMSMYNCFGYEIPRNVDIKFETEVLATKGSVVEPNLILGTADDVKNSQIILSPTMSIDESNEAIVVPNDDTPEVVKVPVEAKSGSEQYTLYIVNVKYRKKYTVAIDCQTKIEMFCGFYDCGKYVTSPEYQEGELESKTYYKTSGNRFRYPFIYDKLNKLDVLDYQHENNLRLFIKVPAGCTSSIVILEGDYIKDTEVYFEGTDQVLGNKFLKYTHEGESFGNYEYLSKKQLLEINTRGKFLLADRLVEYLSEQVITPNDQVINNIKRLQLRLLQDGFSSFEYAGIWDDRMRKSIYEFICSKNLRSKYKDLLYYCDKDVEFNMGGLPLDIGTVYWEKTNYGKEN